MHKFINSVLRESLCDSPFVPVRKCSAVGDNVLGALPFVGNLMEAMMTNDVNDMIATENRAAVAMQNQLNRVAAMDQLKYQNEWNLEQWNRENEYNSPENQVKLLKAAGLNPAYMYGQNGAASAGHLQSAPLSDKAYGVAPQYDYKYQGFGIGAAINAFYQAQLMNSEVKKNAKMTEGISIQNEQNAKGMMSYLTFLQNQAKKEGILGDMAKRQLDYYNAAYDTNLRMLYGDAQIQEKNAKILDEQLNSVLLDNEFKKIVNAYEPKLKEGQVKQMYAALNHIQAQIGLIVANTTLSYEQAAHELEKKLGTVIDNDMKGIDWQIKKDTSNIVVQQAKEQLNKLWRENRYSSPVFGQTWKLQTWRDHDNNYLQLPYPNP